MGMFHPVVKGLSGLQHTANAGYGNTDNPGLLNGALTTVGAGTLTNKVIAGQMVYRTGPTAGFTDTFDTATNLDAGVGGGMEPGDCMVIEYSNQVAFAATIAGASGVTLTSAKSGIAASGYGRLVLRKITSATYTPAYNSSGQPAPSVATAGTYALYVL